MLGGQDFGGSKKRHLPAVGHGREGCVQGDGRLTCAHVGLEQPIHRLGPSQIFADFLDGLVSVVEESAEAATEPEIIELPVVYGGEDGPDLETVAEHAGLSTQEVIEIHSGTGYRVYMIGFAPGFPYLGGLDERIACPRLKTPRISVPAGSVGIAESQTGVYPNASPGGWQLIGRTAVKLFDPNVNAANASPSLITPGAEVRFVPVDAHE